MSVNPSYEEENQEKTTSDKELNFRALEAKYEKRLAEEREEREKLQQDLTQKLQAALQDSKRVEEDDDDEPYVDKKKLNRSLEKFSAETKKFTQSEIKQSIQQALEEERQQMWIKNNPDFYETVQQHAEKLAEKDPELAETILKLPNNFERQKLVYKNIKFLGLDKPAEKQSSVQDKIEANKRSPFYQPANISNSPYSQQGDFSPVGQKKAYDYVQALKNRLNIN